MIFFRSLKLDRTLYKEKMNTQKTLRDSIKFKGVGLHTGCNVNMILEPAKENYGIKFQRFV